MQSPPAEFRTKPILAQLESFETNEIYLDSNQSCLNRLVVAEISNCGFFVQSVQASLETCFPRVLKIITSFEHFHFNRM